MTGIFISYSRVDKAICRQLAETLQITYGGHQVWVDKNLVGGQAWWDEIVGQIAASEVFILLVSPESLDSTYCMMELDEARRRHKHIIPVLVRARTHVPEDIRRLHMISMTEGITVEALTALQAAINRILHHVVAVTKPSRPAARTRPATVSFTITQPSRASIRASGGMALMSQAAPVAVPQAVVRVQRAWLWRGVVFVLVALVGLLAYWWPLTEIGNTQPTPVIVPQQNAITTFLGPTATPGGLMLFYDWESLILINTSDAAIDASGLVFTQGDIQFEGHEWRGNRPLGVLGPAECVQVWSDQSRYLPPPERCSRRLRWRQNSQPNVFWRIQAGPSFDVKLYGATIATCDVQAGACALSFE